MTNLTDCAGVPSVCLEELQSGFLKLLPVVEQHARISFRHVRCEQTREDRIAEAIAVAWKCYVGAVEQGKEPAEFPTALASYAVQNVRCGRRLCGREKSRDALSSVAQRRHGFSTQSLPRPQSRLADDLLLDALTDNTRTSPPDQVCFRLDFPRWLSSLGERGYSVALDLMAGERTGEVAQRYGLTPGRVSQLKTEFHRDWQRFHGETL